MRSTQLNLEQYPTDKVTNKYLEVYDPIFTPLVDQEIKLLELGVYAGGSLLLWKDYFPHSTVAGIDHKLPGNTIGQTERIRLFEGSQTDKKFLSQVANEIAPAGFDIIIDDASHLGYSTKVSFWHLFKNHLKPGGIYVIEDWGTGYWDDVSDGKVLNLESYSDTGFFRKVATKLGFKTPMRGHNYGLVGFIKQLIDEQGADSVTRERYTGKSERDSYFENMIITPAIVFVTKRRNQLG